MKDDNPTRVLVVDDHKMFADGVIAALSQEVDMDVLGSASTGEEALRAVRAQKPDVVLLDHVLPDEDGTVIASQILAEQPNVSIIIITQIVDESIVARAVEAGCAGYITKDKSMSDVVAAIRAAAAGEVTVSPAMLARLFRKMRASRPGVGADLTARELEVLVLLAQGLSNAAISERLTLSRSTVRNHASAILQKLGAHSELEAVLIGMKEGLVEPPQRRS